MLAQRRVILKQPKQKAEAARVRMSQGRVDSCQQADAEVDCARQEGLLSITIQYVQRIEQQNEQVRRKRRGWS